MSQMYDISSKITNELPTLKITDDIIVTIDNRMKTVIKLRAAMNEINGKIEKNELDEMAMMDKSIEMLIGVKKYKEIKALDLPITSYKTVFNTVMSIAIGEYTEEETPNK